MSAKIKRCEAGSGKGFFDDRINIFAKRNIFDTLAVLEETGANVGGINCYILDVCSLEDVATAKRCPRDCYGRIGLIKSGVSECSPTDIVKVLWIEVCKF